MYICQFIILILILFTGINKFLVCSDSSMSRNVALLIVIQLKVRVTKMRRKEFLFLIFATNYDFNGFITSLLSSYMHVCMQTCNIMRTLRKVSELLGSDKKGLKITGKPDVTDYPISSLDVNRVAPPLPHKRS